MAELRRGFVGDLPRRLAEIDELWDAVRSGSDPEDRERLYRAVHSISGAAAMLGLAELGATARSLEGALTPLRETALPPAQASAGEFEEQRSRLGAAVEAARTAAG